MFYWSPLGHTSVNSCQRGWQQMVSKRLNRRGCHHSTWCLMLEQLSSCLLAGQVSRRARKSVSIFTPKCDNSFATLCCTDKSQSHSWFKGWVSKFNFPMGDLRSCISSFLQLNSWLILLLLLLFYMIWFLSIDILTFLKICLFSMESQIFTVQKERQRKKVPINDSLPKWPQ